jgi:hypothetical protein
MNTQTAYGIGLTRQDRFTVDCAMLYREQKSFLSSWSEEDTLTRGSISLPASRDITESDWHIITFEKIQDLYRGRTLANRVSVLFSNIKEIDSIYWERNKNEMILTVFLSNPEYDDELMDILLERELEIREKWRDLGLDFRYIPLIGRERMTLINPGAERIY